MQPLYDFFVPNLLTGAQLKHFPIDYSFRLAQHVGVVMEGVITEEVDLPKSEDPFILRLIGPGGFVQLDALFKTNLPVRRYTCESPVVLALLSTEQFKNSMQGWRDDVHAVAPQELLSQCLQAYEETIQAFSDCFNSSLEERVLVVLQRFQTLTGAPTCTLRRQRLAAILRVAVETISRVLTRLEDDKYIKRGKYDITLLKTKR